MRTLLFFGKVPPPHTGMTLMSATMLELFEELGLDVRVVNTSAGRLRDPGLWGTLRYLSGQLVRMVRSLYASARLMRESSDALVYFCPSSSFLGHLGDQVLLRLLPRDGRAWVLGHVHNGNYLKTFRPWYPLGGGRSLISRMDHVLVLFEGLRDELRREVPTTNQSVFRNVIRPQLEVSEQQVKAKWSDRVDEPCITVTYLSNFNPEKGAEDLVNAMERLHSMHDHRLWRVRFIGSWFTKKQEMAFRERLVRSEASRWFECIGPVHDVERIKRYLLESDVFCLPTYYPIEAQPVSLIEALNAANAVVSTRHAGIPSMIEHGVQGLLVEPRDVEALSEALHRVSDRAVWLEMSKAARRRYLERHARPVVLNEIERLLQIPENARGSTP